MPPLRDLITDPGLVLTPSERKVVRALLDHYPRNGLGPMSRLADHAGVSDPDHRAAGEKTRVWRLRRIPGCPAQ